MDGLLNQIKQLFLFKYKFDIQLDVKEGCEEFINLFRIFRKYLDDESDEISKPSGDASKTSLKRRKETTSASSVDSKPKMKDELEETPPKKVRKVEKSSTESVKKVEDVETEKLTPRKTKKVDEKAIRMEDEKVDIRKDEKDQGKKNEKANKKKEKDDSTHHEIRSRKLARNLGLAADPFEAEIKFVFSKL